MTIARVDDDHPRVQAEALVDPILHDPAELADPARARVLELELGMADAALPPAKRRELADERETLWSRHGVAWEPVLAEIAARRTHHLGSSYLTRVGFSRGFASHAEGRQLGVGIDDLARTSCTSVKLLLHDPGELARLIEGPLLPRLRRLALDFMFQPAPSDIEVLLRSQRLGPLEHFGLAGVCVTPSLAEAIGALSELRSLDLAGVGADSLASASVSALLGAGGLAKLSSLALARHPGLDAKALPKLLDAPFVGQLRTLALTELDFGAKGCKALAKAELGACTQLELRGTKLGKQAAEIVANSTLKRLVRLGLDGTKIGAKLLGDLLAAIDLPELRCLRLGQLRCKAEGAEAIAGSDVFTRCAIVELDLGGNAIADEGAEALAKAEGLAGIRRLSLQANGIRVDGIEALQDSPLFHGLEVLALGNNKIQTKGATALASSALAASLRELDIDHNWIGNKGVAALLGHKGKGLLGLEKIVFGYENNFAFAGLETLVDSPIRLRDLNAGHFGDSATLAAYLGSPAASELRRLVTYFGVEPSLAGEIARGELGATLHTFSCQFAVADEALLDALAQRFAFALQRLEWGLSMW